MFLLLSLGVGTLPSNIDALASSLTKLDVHNNKLHGSLPSTLRYFSKLQFLLVQNNNFDGSLDVIFTSQQNMPLVHVDVSGNRFSGSLPQSIFNSSTLKSFVATSNCLIGSLPQNICGAKQLQVLALDGMGTAVSCRLNVFNI